MPDVPIAPIAPWLRRGTRAGFSESTGADHEVLAAQGAGVKIRVLGWQLVLAGAVTLTWKSNTTALSSAFPFTSAGTWEPAGHYQMYETSANQALNLTLGSGVSVVGDIWYELVTEET